MACVCLILAAFTLTLGVSRYCQPSQPVSAQLPDCPACVFRKSAQLPWPVSCVCQLPGLSAAASVSASCPVCLPDCPACVCPACVCLAARPVSAQPVDCESAQFVCPAAQLPSLSAYSLNMASNCASYTPCNIDVSELTATDLESFLLSISFDPSIAAKLKEII
ncbi:hypothetical protein OUZ56_012315 [Daphnia magna]|uniref:Uncharacterized protein n=1 Tax=Daphnia magna TaxID=35525 RepID=A0ABQ9Z2M7_9CRUS|nr:hypothetical protein OUZ56_012315 [Daphnia magna]